MAGVVRRRGRSRVAPQLRPGVTNPSLWYPDRPAPSVWRKIRQTLLQTHNWTCLFCGHRARKYMSLHHLRSSRNHSPRNLAPVCVACHAVLHIGLNLGVIEIWRSSLPQVRIVRRTREAVRRGKSLSWVKRRLPLTRGPHPPRSIRYANELLARMGRSSRTYLNKPLCAVFVRLKRWQLEETV